MAEFKQIYKPDGTYEEHLIFAGKEYIFRRSPFKAGVAKGLDKGIDEQVEADFPGCDSLYEKILDMTTGFDNGQTVVLWLTRIEKRLEKEQS